MSNLTIPSRRPNVANRRVPLTDQQAEVQRQRGMYTIHEGVRYAIPVDRVKEPTVFLNRDLWRQDGDGRVFRPGVRMEEPFWTWVPKMWRAADKVTGGAATQLRNRIAFGHDVHVTTRGNLFGLHWHNGWANPFEPDLLDLPLDPNFQTLHDTHFVAHECDLDVCPSTFGSWDKVLSELRGLRGFAEELGWLSGAKVTDAFVSEEIDELVSATASEYADFDYHEVGTDNTAENNNQTALIATSGISRATGTPTDSDPDYVSVATVTADATETWEEHGIFNNSTSAALMDRSLTGGQAVNSSDQVEYTYTLTKNPEA